jgi:hypothetical protein
MEVKGKAEGLSQAKTSNEGTEGDRDETTAVIHEIPLPSYRGRHDH